MVGSSKILTVSYGTFSCTLEGFEDSFGTMKEIAEYFRDLAADDRHFGAEPVTPDPEMLARLAERNGGGSIEASRDGSTLLLRASETEAAPVIQDADVAVESGDTPKAATKSNKKKTSTKKRPAKKAATKTAAKKVADAPVDKTKDASDAENKDAQTEADVEAPAKADATGPVKTPAHPAMAPVDLSATDQYEEDYASDVTLDTAAPDTDPNGDDLPSAASVSAKLQRIRAVVSRQQTKDVTDVSDRDDNIASSLSPEDEADLEGIETDTTEGTLSAIHDRMTKAQDARMDDLDQDAEAATEAEGLLDLGKMDGVDAGDNANAASIRATLGGLTDTPDLDMSDPTASADLPNTSDLASDVVDTAEKMDTPTPDLGDADIPEEKADDVFAGIKDVAKPTPRRVRITGAPDDDDGDMDRIMAQTEKKMSAPDTSRRRAAISQLKAAVAATEAARDLGDDKTARKETETSFREDLKQVVRPTRPIRPVRPEGADAAEFPTTARPIADAPAEPAPLKLVASQRIVPDGPFSGINESETPTPKTPVRSRRIEVPAAVQPTGEVDTGSFAAFASDMKAEGLPQLLEAAAAYSVYVEGSDDFSRPQLMSKIKDIPGEDYSREEGLRAFGTLLRESKIIKVSNGRFNVAQDTAFNPASRTG